MLSKKWMTINVLVSTLTLVFLGPVNAGVEKGPYLIYDGVNTEMTVLWQLDSTQTCMITWGESATSSSGSANTFESGSGVYEHQHMYTIAGLTPGTKFFYDVNCVSDYVGNGSFRTAPNIDADSVKFMVYGDTRSNPAAHDSVCAEMINTYTSDPDYQTITLHVGDWVNSGDLEADWANQFFDPFYTNINEFQANMPINGCIGNHEGSGVLFYKYFPYLYEPDGFYWSFDYGPAHIAIVDQYVDYSPGSLQYNWLENDLGSSPKKWKFLIFHEPGWSAGGHSNESDVQDYIHPLAVQNGVDIIFAGHNHYYARAIVDGIQHITTGGGGAPLYSARPDSDFVVVTAESYHFCEVDIQGDDLNLTARDQSGAVLDTFHMNQLASSNSFAYKDIPVKGTVIGSYIDTHELGGTSETITERSSLGKPSSRYSYLEHKWGFNIQAGSAVTVFAEVAASPSSDGDAFVFAWSTDDVNYTTMFTVDDTSASAQSYSLDPTASGAFYVRVVDTDRTAGSSQLLDSISVDQIFIRSDKEQGELPEVPGNLLAEGVSKSEILLQWDNVTDEYGFLVQRMNGTGWLDIATVGADVLTYTDSGLEPATPYNYQVSAFNGAGSSDPSNVATATTYEGSLIELTATSYKVKGVRTADLTWNGADGDSVDIYRDGSWHLTTSNIPDPDTDNFYTDTIGKKSESLYLYVVCESGGTTNCSNEAAVSF